MANMVSDWIISDFNRGEKLTEQNYPIWSCKVQFLLEDQELLEPLTQNMEPPSSDEKDLLDAYNTWKKKSRKARIILLNSMSNDLMLRFNHHQTAKKVWDAVELNFSTESVTMKARFDNYKKKDDHTMGEHISVMKDKIRELKNNGYVLTDEQQVQAMIRSIPEDPNWDLVKQKLTRDRHIRSFEDVASRLMIEEDIRFCYDKLLRSSTWYSIGIGKDDKAADKGTYGNCYNCRDRGHFVLDCPELKIVRWRWDEANSTRLDKL